MSLWFNFESGIESWNHSAWASLLTEYFGATSIQGVDLRHCWKIAWVSDLVGIVCMYALQWFLSPEVYVHQFEHVLCSAMCFPCNECISNIELLYMTFPLCVSSHQSHKLWSPLSCLLSVLQQYRSLKPFWRHFWRCFRSFVLFVNTRQRLLFTLGNLHPQVAMSILATSHFGLSL